MTMRALIEGAEARAVRVKIPEMVASFFETDLAELADDPEGHGLDAGEAAAARLVWEATGRGGGFLAVAPGAAAALSAALTDLSNQADGIAVALRARGDRAGAAWHDRVAGAIGTLAAKVRRA